MPTRELALRMLPARPEAPNEDVPYLPVVGKPAGGGVCARYEVPVDPGGRVETLSESRIGVVALALSGIAPEPPDGHGERRCEQNQRSDQPDPPGPVALPPRWGGSGGEGCLRLHTGCADGRNDGAIRLDQTVARADACYQPR